MRIDHEVAVMQGLRYLASHQPKSGVGEIAQDAADLIEAQAARIAALEAEAAREQESKALVSGLFRLWLSLSEDPTPLSPEEWHERMDLLEQILDEATRVRAGREAAAAVPRAVVEEHDGK